MATITISYARTDGARFDAAYYADTHMPLVHDIWGPLGMTDTEVLFPLSDDQPFLCIALLRFADQAAIDAALADPGSAALMADVANFSNSAPTVYRSND